MNCDQPTHWATTDERINRTGRPSLTEESNYLNEGKSMRQHYINRTKSESSKQKLLDLEERKLKTLTCMAF